MAVFKTLCLACSAISLSLSFAVLANNLAADGTQAAPRASGAAGYPAVVLINRGHSKLDPRYDYPRELLAEVLLRTEDEHDDVTVRPTDKVMPRDRALLELERGEVLHVMAEAPKPGWEERLIPVRIPIRKGIQGYRLFLIKQQNQPMFASVNSWQQLADIATGSGEQWSTRWAMEKAGMEVVTGLDYESLFRMLMHDRFYSFGRGVNEVFTEFDDRQRFYPDLAVESTLVVYIPLPTYFFVSPKYPALAARIERGLRGMIDDGSFDRLFIEHFGAAIKRADLANRKLFAIDNPNLSEQTPLQDAALWYRR
ncbi:hypothetical protein DU002_15960 [Corallincola holothuriorum]|uniref:Solute-binding protein family 3/N-terminal domain-containing protein n=1 Tax=Corallincola holothuriorum TaxID=2282215 RepID=A0A368N3S5_9GAMM|nr:hypothetical protein [Corallincola holothuriorum]RCU45217.1 hypothetical protein DU002_15960 [Corallincola holothuriorum]